MNNKMPSMQLTSCVNTPWPRATTPCCGQSHLFKVLIWSISVLPGILRSLWLDPILCLGLSPLALKHVVTTHPVGCRSFGERTSPGPWGYLYSYSFTLFLYSYSFLLPRGFFVLFFFLNLLSILHTFFPGKIMLSFKNDLNIRSLMLPMASYPSLNTFLFLFKV